MNLSFQIGGTVHNLTCTPEEFEKVLPMLQDHVTSDPDSPLVKHLKSLSFPPVGGCFSAIPKASTFTVSPPTAPSHEECVSAFLNALTCTGGRREWQGVELVRMGGVPNMTSANMPNIIRTLKIEANEARIPIGEILRVSGRTRPYIYHKGERLAEFIAWRKARPATREP